MKTFLIFSLLRQKTVAYCSLYKQQILSPFSVPEHELTEHYATHYQIKLLETITENLKGKVIAYENVWSLGKSPQID
jgi:thiopurine S-methyltransferase